LDNPNVNKVVDLGCGTGASTLVWSEFAKEVLGIEPSKEMLSTAKQKKATEATISFLAGYADSIPLPSRTADIVSCSQSFHWMEPASTLNEINRVLSDNGVLVIYDVIWPPSVSFEFERTYNELFEKVEELTKGLQEVIAHRWEKTRHLDRVRESGHFSFSKETYFHKTEKFSKEQFIGIALSQGGLETLLKRGYSEDEIGITDFLEKINGAEEPNFSEITYNYRVIFVKKSQ
jgi:ubiquinone/menaquinone biosynthesis C-methylase UbiE